MQKDWVKPSSMYNREVTPQRQYWERLQEAFNASNQRGEGTLQSCFADAMAPQTAFKRTGHFRSKPKIEDINGEAIKEIGRAAYQDGYLLRTLAEQIGFFYCRGWCYSSATE